MIEAMTLALLNASAVWFSMVLYLLGIQPRSTMSTIKVDCNIYLGIFHTKCFFFVRAYEFLFSSSLFPSSLPSPPPQSHFETLESQTPLFASSSPDIWVFAVFFSRFSRMIHLSVVTHFYFHFAGGKNNSSESNPTIAFVLFWGFIKKYSRVIPVSALINHS